MLYNYIPNALNYTPMYAIFNNKKTTVHVIRRVTGNALTVHNTDTSIKVEDYNYYGQRSCPIP